MHEPSIPSPSRTPDVYTIHIDARIGPEWAEWFAGSEIRADRDGTGLIIARVRDQAMLFGVLLRLRDLGIPLLGLYPGRRSDVSHAGARQGRTSDPHRNP